ncbi:BON domain-containing protein [Undibacterium sp. Ren11W]|uniref:BON domain-containing protein n=1 Tax=Undibacterium sp. Ren11W TaxID=3413045 RepID=UPI003BF43577
MQIHKIINTLVTGLLLSLAVASVYAAGPGVNVTANAPSLTEQAAVILDDSVITAKVKGALIVDPEVAAMKINVVTKRGVVVLTGDVPDNNKGDYLIKLVATIEGVKVVQNQLHVKPG